MESEKQYKGLSNLEVIESRRLHGENILTVPKKESALKNLLEKFKDPLIIILLVAGICSLGISLYEYLYLKVDSTIFFEPIGIFVAVLLATGLAFIFEQKADKEFSVLNKINDEEPVKAIRNGYVVEIQKRDVVVGDIILINSGDEIPADGTLLEAVSLQVDESSLTGELTCNKTTNKEKFDSQATFPSNKVLRGTKVLEGHGVFEVLDIGDKTESGKVFEAVGIDDSVKTPLNEQLERIGNVITKIGYFLAIAIFLGRTIAFFLYQEHAFNWIEFITYTLQTIMILVTIVVVSIPEGLPMAVTLSLAYSMSRMLKTHNLVRKMHACETMGAVNVICTDKTGTLTQNQMRIAEVNLYDGDNAKELLKLNMAVNSTAELSVVDNQTNVIGNPTEGALLLYLSENNENYSQTRKEITKLEELPFTTERKYMATVVKNIDGNVYLLVKGAPEIVMSLCEINGNTSREEVQNTLVNYQSKAMRTLAFASKKLTDNQVAIENNKIKINNLTLNGIVAISDPVRQDVPKAIKECFNAGINIKIVTGDTTVTAKEIGRQIGLWTEKDTDRNIITGPEFEALSDEELNERVLDLKIIARARPLDKKRLVETLQAKQLVVAVTGDGTNDAPALKAAHVGLSMGDGTSVAKEASDITITDNSFGSIGRAVMWGRSLYANIQRFILFQMTVNVVACLTVLFGSFMGTESPLTVTQMLWVNLIMDTFAAMALASLPPSRSVMNKKPRNREDFIINKSIAKNVFGIGITFFLFLTALLYVFQHSDITCLTDLINLKLESKHGHLSPYELTLFFTIFVMLQFWNLFNAKAYSTKSSAFHFKNATEFLFIVALILVGQFVIIEVGGKIMNVVPLKFIDWCIIIVATSVVVIIGEFSRIISRKC